VKKPHIFLAAFACGAMAFLSPDALVSAQQRRPDVVLVDVSQIFKNYAGFTEMQADLKAALAVAESDVHRRTEQRKQLVLRLKQLRKGTPKYESLDQTITKQTTEINVLVSQGRRKFATREAQTLLAVYKSILVEVSNYCRTHGVRLALQYNGTPLTDTDYSQIYQKIHRPVLYSDPSIDIPRVIIDRLNRQHSARNAGRTGGAHGPRR